MLGIYQGEATCGSMPQRGDMCHLSKSEIALPHESGLCTPLSYLHRLVRHVSLSFLRALLLVERYAKLFEGCASLLSESGFSGFKDFQDRNWKVKRDYFRTGQGAFSPSGATCL